MKRLFLSVICMVSLVASWAQETADERISQALNSSDWFELRRVFQGADKDSVMPMLRLFSEGMVATYFNRPDEACTVIRSLLNNHSAEIGGGNTLSMAFMLAANEARTGRYAEAAETLSRVIQAFEPLVDSMALDMHRGYEKQYRILAEYEGVDSVPGLGAKDFSIPFRLDSVGPEHKHALTIMLPSLVNGKAQDIVFDTGAGVNVVSTAAAKALGMDVYDVGTRLSGIGEQQGGFAVARELCMGNMKMHNVPFFVVDISSGVDSIDAYMSHLDMIVGVDFMNALVELHVDFENNGIFVPKAQNRLSLEGAPNLCGGVAGGYFVEGTANGEQVTVNLDTGAGNSVLTYSYFESHKEYITTQCRADTLGSAGAGGVKIELAYVLPSLDLQIAGQGYTFPEIYVSTMPGAVDLRKANIGMDYFIKFKKVVFNTKDMFVRLFP